MKNQLILGIGLFLSFTLFAQEHHKIFINEFLASNVSIDADIVDFDDYSDWIELYNDEAFDVDLGGYFITDNLDNPRKWEIPPGTFIESKGFLRFWADGYDDKPESTYWRSWIGPNAERLYFTTDYYHLNFKLSRGGECIGLSGPDGVLVDSVTFGLQQRDVSMGRKPDGSANWLYFGEPTPEASNKTEGVQNVRYAETVQISPESGFYDGSLPVAIDPLPGFTLFQNYPNPFRSSTMIRYQLSAYSDVELSVYDLTGRKVSTLVQDTLGEGLHEAEWNVNGAQPGIYFCTLKTLNNRQVIKMILID